MVFQLSLLHWLESLMMEVDGFVVKAGSGKLPGSESWVCHLLVVWTLANYLTSLCLDLFTCSIHSDINIYFLIFVRIKWENLCYAFKQCVERNKY